MSTHHLPALPTAPDVLDALPPMQCEDVARLLAYTAALDPRMPAADELVLDAWTIALAGVPYEVAERAVVEHYRERPDESIKPAVIVQYWRRVRREVAARVVPAQVTARPVDPEAGRRGIAACVAALARARAARYGQDPDVAVEAALRAHDERKTWLRVRCPFCGAAPMRPCTRSGRRTAGEVWVRRTSPHPSRVEAGKRAEAEHHST